MFNKVYTGYFAQTKKYVEKGFIPVSIALFTPSFFNGECWEDFSPTTEMLRDVKSSGDKEVFTKRYLELLQSIPKEDIEELREITKEANYVMLCYEKYPDFCHRHILAKFLVEEHGFEVEEVGI